ncbi:hypothetical protein [Mycobacterium shigaense]|uniref:Uncharacterized protein n=1 Tax=Mycobacterium shigaense TaxID=722731 RepID=A0A1Z4EI84_9MYCO|nr:hypothetical protein [Mycobacterium shigaense]MEA1123709.1 hypothetical protein [Mycobacterium shigaense]PRI12750.1 hypothetical protein B2J96_24360 [Mycobacterium shigaense]BAX92626.1 hypothetical protein MSG_02482 [Mycobacterium shigaense]
MADTDGEFPDDVPIADAVEQHRAAGDAAFDRAEHVIPRLDAADVPLEATVSDWQEQRETVLIDPEFDELRQ